MARKSMQCVHLIGLAGDASRRAVEAITEEAWEAGPPLYVLAQINRAIGYLIEARVIFKTERWANGLDAGLCTRDPLSDTPPVIGP